MNNKIMIVGGGRMGCGIAAIIAAAGEQVVIVEPYCTAREACLEVVDSLLAELQMNELITAQQQKTALQSITVKEQLEDACDEAKFVIEAIVEDVHAKQDLFAKLDSMLPPDVIIASNTSGLCITEIAAKSINKHRMLTTHFWYPAHLVPLVEVVKSHDTDPDNAQKVYNWLQQWGKAPVLVHKDLPGQLANRILQAVIREASNIVQMGLASPQDVDTAVKMGMGIRFPVWGPLEHVDAVGIDLCTNVQNTVLPGISAAQQANDLMSDMVQQNNLGYKTGKGFYNWAEKDMPRLEQRRNAFIIQALKFMKNNP